MRQRLTATDISIEELLGGAFAFTIPAYQREYSWTREEAIQLVDDIAAVIEDVERDGASTPYFLGTMLLIEAAAAVAGPRPVEVVDGQQRLITLAILLSVLRDMAGEGEATAIDMLVAGQDGAGGRSPHLRLRSSGRKHRTAQHRGSTPRDPLEAAA
jgi:hypothetical protein